MTVEQYKKIISDYNSGKIDKNKWVFVVDNDGGNWCYQGPPLHDDTDVDEELRELEEEKMGEKYGCCNGYADIVNILVAVGVEAEWC